MTLSPSQDNACKSFLQFIRDPNKHEFLLKGAAGTGKSYLVTYLLDLVRDEYKLVKLISPHSHMPNFVFSATTNKAADVLSKMVNKPAATIHTVLGLSVSNDFNTGKARLTPKNEIKNLNNSILIIDESSMINQELLTYIRRARTKFKNCKILFVGDDYQLPPVNENTCPIFHKTETIHELTDILRQTKYSPIISFSQKYREILDNPELEWPVIPHDGTIINHYTDSKQWKSAIMSAYQQPHEIDDLRVLAWSNDRVIGYNNWIRKQLGFDMPYQIGETMLCNNAITIDHRIHATTNSLHQLDDYYPTTIQNILGHTLTFRAFNGTYIKIFQPDDWTVANTLLSDLASKAKHTKDKEKRKLLWKEFWDIKNAWGNFRPIHAQTIHKSQGSTYQEVFIDLEDIARNNKWHEVARLMYVAITRASHKVHIYGNLAERYTRKDPKANLMRFRDGKNKTTYS